MQKIPRNTIEQSGSYREQTNHVTVLATDIF